ncbi:MAG: ribose 5-phosphate isomerase B [Candidatus Paceibacteria bacterium]|jgi:ribose 5-phosphate isomerase B
MNPARLQSIVRKVAQRALNQGSAVSPGQRSRGVHVEVGLKESGTAGATDTLREVADAAPSTLITAEDLAGTPPGGHFVLPAGARMTALAEEEAWNRGIEWRAESTSQSGSLRVAIGADHGGYPIKEEIKGWLRQLGHQPLDLGTHGTDAVDYPDFAAAVASAVARGEAHFGVCVDGAGIGSAMAANKVPGARAAMCYDEKTAKNAREHNFANVLSLGGPMLGSDACRRILVAFLSTPEGAPRHARRVDKILAIESKYTAQNHPLRRVLPETGAT